MSRTSLSRRLPLVMAGVAAIAVLIAALVAWPLITSAADTTAEQRRCSPRSRSPPTW